MSDPTAEAFASIVASLDAAVVVVTTAAGGERAGCMIGFYSQCSIQPGRMAVWLSKANHTYRVGLLADRFAVHFLTEDDIDVAELFATETGDEVDKFSRCAWTPWLANPAATAAGGAGPADGTPVPLLDRCPNRVLARRHSAVDDGSDHVCFVLEPVDAGSAGSFVPLRFSDVKQFEPGHPAEERPTPADERSA